MYFHMIHGSLDPYKSILQTVSQSVQMLLQEHQCDRTKAIRHIDMHRNSLHLAVVLAT